VKSFQIESEVRLSREDAWRHATSPQGVNAEFWPILRMAFPATVSSLSDEWSPGRPICRCWILLFGILPVEYDDLSFVEVEEGRRFLERSEMLTQKLWQHEREIVEKPPGVLIRDRISFSSRMPALERIQLTIFRLVFRYRHFRLLRLFGHNAVSSGFG